MNKTEFHFSLNIRGDLRDERNGYLGLVQSISLIAGISLFVILSNAMSTANFNANGILLLLGGGAISYVLRSRQWLDLAAYIYLIGLTGVFAFQLWQVGSHSTFYFLLVLPLVLGSLLLDHEEIPRVTSLVILAAFLGVALRTNIAEAFISTRFPAVLYAIIAAMLYVKNWDALERLRWTLNNQHKDNRRAEHFYDQSEELQKALLQVQHYSSKLELVNKQLAEAQQKAESASKAKSTFLSNMSHELRTPLNVIIGYSSSMLNMPQMFQNKRIPEVHRPYLQLIEENGHYLLGLINDTLDLSKIEAGKLDLHCESTSLPNIFRGVLATATGLLKGKPIQLRSDFADDLTNAWADPMRVRQIILNLMSNAVKFTESGSVTLSARAAGEFVEIAVSDTGIGIPDKALAVIFDRFQQAEKDTDRKYGGTGLGLDISKQLSLMQGGDLTVTSEAGRGSTFMVKLPIARQGVQVSAELLADATEANNLTHADMTNNAEPQIVLLVEDEVNTRHLLRQTLENVGYVVVDTSSGSEALNIAEGLLPDLIILDVFLPDANGWQLLRKLKANPETQPIPVIMCTADDDIPETARQLQPMYYLPKPFTPELILDFVDEAIASKPSEREKQPWEFCMSRMM
jgi:signal transduction histidine kinase/ActR/RegA family two-component response regulator